MSGIKIIIDGLEADPPSKENFPFRLSLAVDSYEDPDKRLKGSKVSTKSPDLKLNATPRNSRIVQSFWGSQPIDEDVKSRRPISVFVNGNSIFEGFCILKSDLRSRRPKEYTFRLEGDSLDPLSQLNDVYLSDLDIGYSFWDVSDQQASFGESFANLEELRVEFFWETEAIPGGMLMTAGFRKIDGTGPFTYSVSYNSSNPILFTDLPPYYWNKGYPNFIGTSPTATLGYIPGQANSGHWYEFRLTDAGTGTTYVFEFYWDNPNFGTDAFSPVVTMNRQGFQRLDDGPKKYWLNSRGGGWWPVVYGALDKSLPNDDFNRYDLRFHVSHRRILYGIIEEYLGYRIVSDFEQDPVFYRAHNVFGVGDGWKRSDVLPKFIGSQNFVPENPAFFLFPGDGYWSLKLTIETDTSGYIQTYGNGSHNGKYYNPTPGVSYTFEINLDPERYDSITNPTDIFYITVNGGGSVISSSMEYEFRDIMAYGAPFSIASCLPKDDVKTWLKGIFHQYNLAGRFDIITKRFFLEPRHTYFTESSSNKKLGYYIEPISDPNNQNPLDWSGLVDAKEITKVVNDDLGDSLELRYKEDSSDPLWDLIKERDRLEGASPTIYGTKDPLMNRGNEGTVSENPYFHNLFNIFLADDSVEPSVELAAALPESFELDSPLPPPTFECEPKCALFYGETPSNIWSFEGVARPLPLFFMQPPRSSYIANTFVLTYADTNGDVNEFLSSGPNRGLNSVFWKRWISIMRDGIEMNALVKFPNSNIQPEDFRKLRYIDFSLWVLAEIEEMNPTENGLKKMRFFRWNWIKAEDDQMINGNYHGIITKGT
jgi:hypothetical protein